MARAAHIVATVADVWGDGWDVREARATAHGFDVLLGWPAGQARGRGAAGGPRVIVTAALAAHLDTHRLTPAALALPLGRTAIKRLRRLVGHHWRLDRAAWWEARADELAALTTDQFAARHQVSTGATAGARRALFGPRVRPAGWWRAPDIVAALTAQRPRAAIADELGISIGAVGRLRAALKSGAI